MQPFDIVQQKNIWNNLTEFQFKCGTANTQFTLENPPLNLYEIYPTLIKKAKKILALKDNASLKKLTLCMWN